jgi:DNA-binding CsgD family transcriptional regulator
MMSPATSTFGENRSFELDFYAAKVSLAVECISLFKAALCVVDRDLRVIASNAAAEAYLGANPSDGFLSLLRACTDMPKATLRDQLRDGICSGAGVTVLLEADQRESLICTVRPIESYGARCGIVMLASAKGGSDAIIPSLRQIYSLSKAEAEIAVASAAGMDIIDVAQTRGVSISTLRAQVASLKAKMGMSRMTEVAVTVCRLEALHNWF